MPSTAPKTSLKAVLAALLVLLAAGPANAAAAPKLKAAYNLDRDRDGHVDSVLLTWSKKVRGGADRKPPFAFKVKGYKVTRVYRARKKKQRIRVAEKRTCDIGASVTVKHRKRTLDMRRFDPKVPRITCAVTLDADGDSRIDGLRLTYSRKVRSRAQRKGDFLFSAVGYRVKRVARARGRFLVIRLGERAEPDSGATPIVGYSRPSSRRTRRYAVRSGRRGKAFSGTFQGTRDGVSPTLLAAITGDGDRDGLLDSMAVRFSEPVTADSPAALSVLGMKVRSAAAFGNGLLGLALVENTARGDARPGVWTAGTGVRDAAGNQAFKGAATPRDGAAPIVTGAVTLDSGGSRGRIDGIRVSFSEPVVHPRDAGGSYPFEVAGRSVVSVEQAQGQQVEVRLAEGRSPDTGDTPLISHRAGAGRAVADAAGNGAIDASKTARDAVAPVLLAAATADSDADGRIDGLGIGFSEPVQHPAEGAGSSFSVGGYSVTSAGAASGRQLALGLQEAGTHDSGARPSVGYTRDGTADVVDAAGNIMGDATLAQAADAAPPVLLAARTADADGDHRLDRVETSWSEPLVHAEDASGPFPVSSSDATVVKLGAADGASLAVELAETSDYDTGSTPDLAYDGGADPIRDAAGLEPAKGSWAALTADALVPRLVGAATADRDSDGRIDALTTRFSEAVLHAREDAQGSFAATGHAIAAVEEASGERVQLTLQEAGAGDSGARPTITYNPDGLEDVRDAAGNFAPAESRQADDGAPPVLLGAQTQDGDDDGRIDGIATTWSEVVENAEDAAAPFALSAKGFELTRVRAAAGQELAIDLVEPAAHDTGSAPDVTYTAGGEAIRDLSGLEAEQKAYSGLTRDALPPRLVGAATADADFDGRIDAVDLEWSEQVTGATGSAPYSVSGRTLAANVSFNGPRTRIPFSEVGSGHDSAATPAVSYDAGVGDLHDIAEGAGDDAAVAPAVTAQTPADKAAPILIAAKTADLSTPDGSNAPNGTIDAVLVTFSEPIVHAVDGVAPFSLNVAGRTETQVESNDGSAGDRTLYVTVAESSSPDGGYKPDVSVSGSVPAADRIRDRAAPANDARPMTFSGTADEVRPVLLSAQLGERGASGGCTKEPVEGIDGKVDCMVTDWSEPVRHDADSDGTYSLGSTGWGVDAGGIPQLGPSASLEILLTPGASADRDRQGTTVSYDEAVDTPVVDAATPANESLSGTEPAAPPCRDGGQEPNDAVNAGNPLLNSTSPAFERKCAFDEDWYRVKTAPGSDYLQVLTRPVSGVDVSVEVTDAAGDPIAGGAAELGGTGEVDKLTFPVGGALDQDTTYWVRVGATDTPTPQEGSYCVVYSSDFASAAGCGPLVGQLVFTEVGLGDNWFVEIKNDFEVPVDMDGAGANLVLGSTDAGTRRECTLAFPEESDTIIGPDEHVVIQQSASATAFGCNGVSTIAASGERLELSANGAIDVVDLSGVINSPLAAEHSLQFVEGDIDQDNLANDEVDTNWCRTFSAATKGAVGDGCDEYRINEVLWKPTGSSTTSDGRAFVEIAGNLPALANSTLLAGWIVRGVDGLSGEGTEDLVLPAGASPRPNGTYVLADGVSGSTQVATSDHIWDLLDLNSPSWPDGGVFGPRGLQLLRPGAGNSPPCTASADAFGWTSTAEGFTQPLDDQRSCPGLEGQEYTNGTVGASAARDNLSSAGDSTYNVNRDTNQNRGDFCPQATPNPGSLNIRLSC